MLEASGVNLMPLGTSHSISLGVVFRNTSKSDYICSMPVSTYLPILMRQREYRYVDPNLYGYLSAARYQYHLNHENETETQHQ